jgi:hypothetical protein
VLTKGTTAEVQIALRSAQVGGVSSIARGIPLETFAINKDMGRILIRRNGETVAAGVLNILFCMHQCLLTSHFRRCDRDQIVKFDKRVMIAQQDTNPCKHSTVCRSRVN